MSQRFALKRYGRLLACKAVVAGPSDGHEIVLLLDSGSNYTVIPVEVAEKIGCSPSASQDHVRIVTGSGVLILPRVPVRAVTVFDQRIEGVQVIIHDLPFEGPIDGLLGMDLLTTLRARIDIPAAQIEVG